VAHPLQVCLQGGTRWNDASGSRRRRLLSKGCLGSGGYELDIRDLSPTDRYLVLEFPRRPPNTPNSPNTLKICLDTFDCVGPGRIECQYIPGSTSRIDLYMLNRIDADFVSLFLLLVSKGVPKFVHSVSTCTDPCPVKGASEQGVIAPSNSHCTSANFLIPFNAISHETAANLVIPFEDGSPPRNNQYVCQFLVSPGNPRDSNTWTSWNGMMVRLNFSRSRLRRGCRMYLTK